MENYSRMKDNKTGREIETVIEEENVKGKIAMEWEGPLEVAVAIVGQEVGEIPILQVSQQLKLLQSLVVVSC